MKLEAVNTQGRCPIALATLAAALTWSAPLVTPPLVTLATVAPTPLTIRPRPGAEPELVAYRAETTQTWTVLKRSGDGYFLPAPAARYTVVIVCPPIHRATQVEVFHLAAQDLSTLEPQCRADTRARKTVPVRLVGDARETVVFDQHVSVSTDGNGRVVDRDGEVSLPDGRWDWVVMTDKPFRVGLEHDVPVSWRRRSIDVSAARPPDRMRVRLPENATGSVTFMSRSGTEYVGLGESDRSADLDGGGTIMTHDIVPRELRKPGDHDIVHVSRWDDDSSHAATSLSAAPAIVDVALPAAKPVGELTRDGEIRWRDAGRPDLVEIWYSDYPDENGSPINLSFDTRASRRWLAGRTSLRLVDPSGIPGWNGRPTPTEDSARHWIFWSWTSDPNVMPLQLFTPPVGVTFQWIGHSFEKSL